MKKNFYVVLSTLVLAQVACEKVDSSGNGGDDQTTLEDAEKILSDFCEVKLADEDSCKVDTNLIGTWVASDDYSEETFVYSDDGNFVISGETQFATGMFSSDDAIKWCAQPTSLLMESSGERIYRKLYQTYKIYGDSLGFHQSLTRTDGSGQQGAWSRIYKYCQIDNGEEKGDETTIYRELEEETIVIKEGELNYTLLEYEKDEQFGFLVHRKLTGSIEAQGARLVAVTITRLELEEGDDWNYLRVGDRIPCCYSGDGMDYIECDFWGYESEERFASDCSFINAVFERQ
jgi:hypothetical protein